MGLSEKKEKINPVFERLLPLIGEEALFRLEKIKVAVVGIGGVGSWCAEALVRSGIGNISIIDNDTVCESNINRQAEAVKSNLGRFKTEAFKERLLDINSYCKIKTFQAIFSKETAEDFNLSETDFVIDAIDTFPCKLDLIEYTLSLKKRLFSSMGMGQKLDPTQIKTADIWETSGCPLARIVRQGLKTRGINGHFVAVYSPERVERVNVEMDNKEENNKKGNHDKKPIGSIVNVTATAGMVLSSLVIREVIYG